MHQRIRDDIQGRILRGDWVPGHRVPSEHELMAEYACSRMTVNKALTQLASAGLIERRRRAGSFVARPHPHLEQVALQIPDIEAEVSARGLAYRFELLQRRLRAPRAGHAEERALAEGGRVLALDSRHLADGRPFALEQRLIDPLAVPAAAEQDFAVQAPGSWLLRHVPWTRAEHRISAINADAAQSRLLDVPDGTACLVIERRTWRDEQPVTWVRQVFLGSFYDLIARFSPGLR
ncbi:histidine utilization repressor [Stenotrophomonas panacihumi]|uniref:Histidine utilization repressor n=1 Tax=Stenotrophomonas panacihumi TaxID=676599 RepID=A0A0R0AY55_9GAMM|nr:histidine utilization repressor [Stenotrophomonas panacihumi]